jgi:hypothetical protein
MPARVGTALDLGSRDAFLTAYREHTDAVRKTYDEVMNRSHDQSRTGHLRLEPHARRSVQ